MRISEEQNIVLGPPGCGKTSYILNSIENLMERGVPPDKIAFVSFTKKAISEATDRALDKFSLKKNSFPLFKTIHALAFNGLGVSKKDMVSKEHYREFGEHTGYLFEGTWDESEGIPVGDEKGDKLLFLDNLARITQRPLKEVWEENYVECEWEELERFQDAYQDYKSGQNIMDFTDLLYAYVAMCDPSRADYTFVDEAQDLSAAQWMVLKHAFGNVNSTTIAGDDDQSIYKWSGADIRSFLSLEGDRKILSQSYRLPKAVHRFATALISKVETRFDKQFNPREQEGELNFFNSLYDIELDPNQSSLILVRNGYLSKRASQLLYEQGIPFYNKGYSSLKPAHVRAIKAMEKLRKNQAITGADAKAMYEQMRIGYYLDRGNKTKIVTVGDREEFTFEVLRDNFGLKDLAPWYTSLEGLPTEQSDYYRLVLSNGYGLTATPKCSISTIHAAKGGEADHVVLLSDMAQRSYQEYEKSPDDERRVAYVGITRAKEKLSIVQPQSKMYFPYYNEGN